MTHAPEERGFLRECVPVFLGAPLLIAIAYALLFAVEP
jgi:hypothetical protein